MRQYKIGDIVQIRQWDDMAEEFGTTIHGSIACRTWRSEERRVGKECRSRWCLLFEYWKLLDFYK